MRPEPASVRATIAGARSFLFVPGDRPERFDKAVACGADMIVLDLEDAVAPANKVAARDTVAAWLRANGAALVRVNALDTPWCAADLALADLPGILGFMLPKAEAGTGLDRVAGLLPTIALIENAGGVATVDAVAATSGVERLAYGTVDLALDLEITATETLATIGTALVVASRRHGLPAPIDGVTLALKDAAAINVATRDARNRGFGAKLCIHPAQVGVVANAFRPTAEEVDRARRIVAADQHAGGSAVALYGRMIDRPIVAKAYRMLTEASPAASA